MHELIPILIALACPFSMATMMALPALSRVFSRRADRTALGAN